MWGVAANTGSIFYYISPMATALKVGGHPAAAPEILQANCRCRRRCH
jgi:hypothetical protein